ncbi:uncharacterized protein [Branchiostoma lanceolatum]|uniref:uncharacterized protein n=1 Tax=Branchiostoma lanceolatum TaxID=7740 RepID=UPI003452C428
MASIGVRRYPREFLKSLRSMITPIDAHAKKSLLANGLLRRCRPRGKKADLPTEATSIEGYSSFRRDRPDKRGGGVAVYVKNYITAKPVDLAVPSELECVWVHLRPPWLPREITSIALCGVYNPPASPNEDALLDHLSESMDLLRNSHPDIGLLVLGDLNRLDFSHLCRSHSLEQVVDIPTRGNAVLDQIMTNIGGFYRSPSVAPPVGNSDHNCVLLFGERRKPPNYTCKKVVRPMRDSDLRAFGSWITSHNWDEVLQETNTQAKSTTFYTTLNQAIEKFLPAKTVRTHCRDKPWITPMIKSLISKRQRAFKKGDTCAWKHLRNKIACEISTAKNKHYHDNIKHLKSADPRKWYQNIKQMANLCSDPTDIEVPGVDQTCTETVANAINRHLASASQQLPPLSLADLPSFLPAPGPPPRVSVWEMYHRLRRVKLGKASGVDGISARLVREFAFELSTPVSDIFNSSLQEGTVPSVWKMADVVPVPKEKPPRLEKLRPISLTPIFAKVCEGFVTEWCLSDILPTIDPRQYGSLKGKSTTHYLTSLTHHLASTTDKPGYCNTLVLTDFTRAFDRVHHLTAVAKLLDLGVRRSIIPWVCAFLSNRQQRVKYQQVLSEWETLTCGVPQGTKLGPLVFLTLINDASPVSEDSAEAWKYVDDMSLSEARPVTHDSTLQTDVDSLVRWTEDNHMQLNPSKCMVMLICFTRNPPPPPVLTIKSSTLQVVQFAKILGVIFQANLKWDAHVNMMVA